MDNEAIKKLINEYSENIAVNIIWVKEEGVRTPVVSQDITFVRNHLTTIEFEVKNDGSVDTTTPQALNNIYQKNIKQFSNYKITPLTDNVIWKVVYFLFLILLI